MVVLKEGRSSGFVGIWWYTDSYDIWGVLKDLDSGYNDNNYIQYSNIDNHMSLWRKIVKDNTTSLEEFNNIYNKGYKSLERGRVIYNLRTQSYEIICSQAIYKDPVFRSKCLDYFELNNCRYDFIPLSHYYKVELTGNPSLDKFNYEI